MRLTQLDLCIANVAGVEDPYNDAAWTTAKALKLDADIAEVLESPRRPAPGRTALANAYERGMFTRDDLTTARGVLSHWVASLRETRLTAEPSPARKETDMAYGNRFGGSPRWGRGADERNQERRRQADQRRTQAAREDLADIAMDGGCDCDCDCDCGE